MLIGEDQLRFPVNPMFANEHWLREIEQPAARRTVTFSFLV